MKIKTFSAITVFVSLAMKLLTICLGEWFYLLVRNGMFYSKEMCVYSRTAFLISFAVVFIVSIFTSFNFAHGMIQVLLKNRKRKFRLSIFLLLLIIPFSELVFLKTNKMKYNVFKLFQPPPEGRTKLMYSIECFLDGYKELNNQKG